MKVASFPGERARGRGYSEGTKVESTRQSKMPFPCAGNWIVAMAKRNATSMSGKRQRAETND